MRHAPAGTGMATDCCANNVLDDPTGCPWELENCTVTTSTVTFEIQITFAHGAGGHGGGQGAGHGGGGQGGGGHGRGGQGRGGHGRGGHGCGHGCGRGRHDRSFFTHFFFFFLQARFPDRRFDLH